MQTATCSRTGSALTPGTPRIGWCAITYPAQPGKQTGFAYDGLDRRTAISSTPAGGGSAVTTSYLWCGSRPCQARNGTNAVTRGYYAEGELVPGAPAQPYYYGSDQLGSVRRAFASTSSAPAYGYDPYGNALQATAPLTDFGYAGMLYNADSGLYLTQYRAYNPVAGRWLSRDPNGESSDPAANLYAYVNGNPLIRVDPWGLADVPAPTDANGNPLPPPVSLPNGKNGESNSWVPCAPSGSGSRSAKWKPKFSVPSPYGGQPGASWDPEGHWDIDNGQGDRQRIDENGNPVEHGNPQPLPPPPSTSSNRSIQPPPWWMIIPLLPFPGNPLYGGA